MVGILCQTKDELYIRLHVAIGSYSADLPEQKDMLFLKHSNRTLQPYTRYNIKRNEQAMFIYNRTRTIGETKILDKYEMKMKIFNEMRKGRSNESNFTRDEAQCTFDEIPIIPKCLFCIYFLSLG